MCSRHRVALCIGFSLAAACLFFIFIVFRNSPFLFHFVFILNAFFVVADIIIVGAVAVVVVFLCFTDECFSNGCYSFNATINHSHTS